MTNRLYYNDAYTTEFEAHILQKEIVKGQPAIVLDKTYFYPTSGGQPYDTGRLAGRQVIEVVDDKESGRILHVLDGDSSGQSVRGSIDWPRRFDHMQQHSGQHLISQTFYQLFGFETVSMRIGQVESTLDLDTSRLDPPQLNEAERFVNDLIYENRAIVSYYLDDSELERLPLRGKPKVTGQIRIVEITDFDYSACGGTHCRSTGQIGLIKLLRQERRRGNVRLTFRCGKRALADYAEKHQLITTGAGLLDVNITELPQMIERCLASYSQLQKQYGLLEREILGYEAEDLFKTAEKRAAVTIVTKLFSERELTSVKSLAHQLQEKESVIILFGSVSNKKLSLVYARSADVKLDMSALLRDSLANFNGRGGGRPDFVQGGSPDPTSAQAILDDSREKIMAALNT